MVPNRAGGALRGELLAEGDEPGLGEEEGAPLPAGEVELEVVQFNLDRPPGPRAAVLWIPIEGRDRARIPAAAVRREDQGAAGQVERIGGHDVAGLELYQDLIFRGDGNPTSDLGDLDGTASIAAKSSFQLVDTEF